MKVASQLIYIEEIDSTNKYLQSKVSKLNPKTALGVYAAFQTEGKGQIGRTWVSEKSKNLLFSFFLFLRINPNDQFIISKYLSICIVEYLQDLGIKDVSIKWPNDIYVKDKKIAGILIQNNINNKFIQYTIAGIGLNLNQVVFPHWLPNPTSYQLETKKAIDIKVFLDGLIIKLNVHYEKLLAQDFNYFDVQYLEYMYRLYQESYFMDQGTSISAKIMGVDSKGRLNLLVNNKSLKHYNFNEVTFVI